MPPSFQRQYVTERFIIMISNGEKKEQSKRTVIIQIHPRSDDIQWEKKYDCMKFYHEIIQSLYINKGVILSYLVHTYLCIYPLPRRSFCLNIYTHNTKRWKWKEIKHRNEIMKAGNEKWYNRKFPIKIKSLLLQLYTAKLSSSSSSSF